MADSKSILPKPSDKYPSGLRKYVQVSKQKINLPLTLPRLDILFGLPNKYTEEEKKKWWEEHKEPNKQFKIGLIKTKELDTRINIFGEVFDFSKTAKREAPLTDKEAANVKQTGFNTSENVIEEEVEYEPETYYTSKDFDKLYLGWLNPEDKARRISLKQLFRFIFGNRRIKEVNKFHTKLLAAYTNFKSEEKVPCGPFRPEDPSLRSDFENSLQYRRELVIKEVEAANQSIGENNMYMEGKKAILQGLRELLNRMNDREEKTKCFVYGNDDTMKEDVDENAIEKTFSDEDMIRLVRIFQNYINTMDKFKGKNVQTQGKELYEELRKLLELSNKAGSLVDTQKELEDMTQLVEHLSFLLDAYSELHKIHIEIKDLQIQLEKKKYEDILEKNKELETKLGVFVEEIEEGTTEVSQLLSSFAQSLLNKTTENSEKLREEIITKFVNKEGEVIQSKQALEKAKEDIQKLEQEKVNCDTKLTDVQTEITATKTQLEKLTQSLETDITPTILSQTQEIERLLQELDVKKSELQKQKEELTARIEALTEQIESERALANKKLEEYRVRIDKLEKEGAEYRVTIAKLSDERKILEEQVGKTLAEGVEQLRDIRIQYNEKRKELEEEIQEKNTEIARAREQLEGVMTELGQLREAYEQDNASQKESADKENELRGQRDRLQQILDERMKEIRGYEEKKLSTQGGGSTIEKGASLSKEATCETMLTLLLFHIKDANMNVQDFLDKAGATLDDLGQCPIVLHVLNEMLDEADDMESKEDSIVYSPIRSEKSNEVMDSIEKSVQGRFNEEEQEVLASLNKPITFYSKPPETYTDSMGTNAYMLNNNAKVDIYETPMNGLLNDEITLTKEEREEIEKGGISLGAITFLYLTCLRDIQSRNETPTSSSKCLLPKRSLERSKTPKQSHKRKASTLRSRQSMQPTQH